jgi:hypothetical protein
MGELFLFGDWSDLPIKPRLNPLVIGPSGIGKSHVLRSVAAEMGIKYMRVTGSGWIIAGARQEPTLLRIQEFVATNEQGILHLDECEKIGGLSEWCGFMRGEIFDLLDRTPPIVKDMEWSPDVISKLKNDFWCVASGTFQDLWAQAAKARVGFGEPQSAEAYLENVRRLVASSDIIPAELLRRFNEDLIILPPATEEDFQQAADMNGLTQLAVALNTRLNFEEAVASGRGARWLEEMQARLLLQARRLNRMDLAPMRPFMSESSSDPDVDVEDDRFLGGDNPKFGITNSVL